jgi:hypothetical protein
VTRTSRVRRHALTTKLAGLSLVGLLGLIGALVAAPAAHATVSVSRAELSGTKLRVEGTAIANRTITVDEVAMATSDREGNFKIERDPFAKPADCTVAVNDGSATSTTATLSGCTVSSSPSSPSLSGLTINPDEVIQGDSATGTVTLSSAAPSGGFIIDLTNDAPDIATVPLSVTVPGGSTSANFTVTTFPDSRCCSATIVGTVGGDWNTHKYAIITVYTEFAYNHGSIAIIPGGGSGRVTSSPAGIDCTITDGEGGSGTCWSFFPTGTVVKLEARPAPGYSFLGWKTNLPGCSDPSKVEVRRGNNVDCQPVFRLK